MAAAEKPKKKPKLPRNEIALAAIRRKGGAHKDRKKEADKRTARRKVEKEEDDGT